MLESCFKISENHIKVAIVTLKSFLFDSTHKKYMYFVGINESIWVESAILNHISYLNKTGF